MDLLFEVWISKATLLSSSQFGHVFTLFEELDGSSVCVPNFEAEDEPEIVRVMQCLYLA